MFESKKNNIWFNIGNVLTANTSSTLLTILGGKETLFGADFGVSETTKHFKLTLTKFVGGVASVSEIVKVTAKSGNALTIVRAYEPCPLNTNATVMTQSPQVFDIGDFAYMNMTASDLIELGALVDTKQNNCILNTITTNTTFTGTEKNGGAYSVNTTSGNITITINPALFDLSNGLYEFSFCKATNNINTVTIDATSGKTIDGSQTLVLTNYNEVATLIIATSSFIKIKSQKGNTISVNIPILDEDVTGDITADFFVKNNGTGNNTKIKLNRYMASDSEATTGTNQNKYINPKQAKDNYLLKTDTIQITRDTSLASNTVTYNHGLGKVPKLINIESYYKYASSTTAGYIASVGTYTNSKNQCTYRTYNGSNYDVIADTSNCVRVNAIGGGAETYGYITNLTSTTFDIVWTKVNASTGTLLLQIYLIS